MTITKKLSITRALVDLGSLEDYRDSSVYLEVSEGRFKNGLLEAIALVGASQSQTRDGASVVISSPTLTPELPLPVLVDLGQSLVMRVLDVTNLQLAGRFALILGFHAASERIASAAAALGAQVVVATARPDEAVSAYLAGHSVAPLAEAVKSAGVIFATEDTASLAEVAEGLPSGAIVIDAGGGLEPLLTKLQASSRTIRTDVRTYHHGEGTKEVFVVESSNDWLTGTDRSLDALIAYTLLKALNSSDPHELLALAMVDAFGLEHDRQ